MAQLQFLPQVPALTFLIMDMVQKHKPNKTFPPLAASGHGFYHSHRTQTRTEMSSCKWSAFITDPVKCLELWARKAISAQSLLRCILCDLGR